METRKAQQLGPSTLAVTLPAEWTRENDVEKGDDIVILTSKGRLWIENEAGLQVGSEVTVHAENLNASAVGRAVIAQYALGQRVIHVTNGDGALDDAHVDAVYDAESQLMGLGVIEETPESISIRCSVDPKDFSLDDLLSRLESTGRTMLEEGIKALAHGNPDLARPAFNRERQANKIFVLLLRLIYTVQQDPTVAEEVGLDDYLPLIGYRSIAKNLELVADNAQDIAELTVAEETAPDIDSSVVREIRDFSDEVATVTEQGVAAAIDRDYNLAIEVHERFAELEDRESAIREALPEMDPEATHRVREALVNLKQIAEIGTRNAEIAANITLTSDSEYVSMH